MKISKARIKKIINEEAKLVIKEMSQVGDAQREYEDELEEVASAFRDLYKSIYNFKPEVKNTDTIDDLKREIKKLMDKQEAQKFDELVRYAKENPPSSDDPDDMRYE
jgi:selenocysteine-specific translation elongation factor